MRNAAAESAAASFQYMWLVIAAIVMTVIATGATFGWVGYFNDDGFAPQFTALKAADMQLMQGLQDESSTRAFADMVLMNRHAQLSGEIQTEIARRTAEDAILLQLILTEVALRTAGQAALNTQLDNEIAGRTDTDDYFFWLMRNLTDRMDLMQAFDLYTIQQFMIKMDNLTHIDEWLAQEAVDRAAADMVFMAQDPIQQAAIVAIGNALAAETAARVAADMAHMAGLAPILATGIFLINGHEDDGFSNFNLVSGNSGYTIGNPGGPGNIITIRNNALHTFGGMTPHPTSFNIDLVPGNNVIITQNPAFHSVTVGLENFPVPANYAVYSGSVTSIPFLPDFIPAASPGSPFFFDADYTGPYNANAGTFITNFNTYNGFGWEVPVANGTGYGIWEVRIQLTLVVDYRGTPKGQFFTAATCQGTRASCIMCPSCNTPQTSYGKSLAAVYTAGDMAGWGINRYDTIFEFTVLVNGIGVPAGTGVYPVWKIWRPLHPVQEAMRLDAIRVVYEVTRLF